MREGKTLILATKEYANDIQAKSWWCVISTGSLLLASLVGTYFCPLFIKPAMSILAGLLIVRFFVIYHDHQHRAILANSKLADVIMTIFGMYTLCPSTVWKSSHNYHHAHNCKLRSAHIGSFPIMTKDRFQASTKSDRWKYQFIRHPLTICFGYLFMFMLGMCVYPFLSNPRKHIDSLLSLMIHFGLGAYLYYLDGWQGMFFVVFLPAFVSTAIGSYLFYAQHNFPDVTLEDQDGWTYEGAALKSSSFMKMNPIMNWFTGNIGYHHIHHINSRIPFYRLPEVMKKMPELQSPKVTSLSPIDVYKCLKLHVWCPESNRMLRKCEC